MKALLIAGRLVTDQEVFGAVYCLEMSGWTVDIAVRGMETVLGEKGIKIVPHLDIPDININNYQLLILPGGAKGMEYMRQDKQILATIAAFHLSGRTVAAICHGTQLLISANLVHGREISGYYSIADDIRNAGGKYVDAPAVVSDRVVTSPHYKYTGQWMAAAIKSAEKIDD